MPHLRRIFHGRRARMLGLMTVALGAALIQAPPALAQSVSVNLGSGSQSLAGKLIGIVAITSLLAIAPGILVMGTSFTRIVVVLSMLRTALGLQQTPPNSVLISLAIFLTGFIMAPAFETAYHNGLQPLLEGSITEEQALGPHGGAIPPLHAGEYRR